MYDYLEDEWYDEDYEPECMFWHEQLRKAANGQLYIEQVSAWAWSRDEEIDSFYWHWETKFVNPRRYLNDKGLALAIAWARKAKPGAAIDFTKLFAPRPQIKKVSAAKRGVMKWGER